MPLHSDPRTPRKNSLLSTLHKDRNSDVAAIVRPQALKEALIPPSDDASQRSQWDVYSSWTAIQNTDLTPLYGSSLNRGVLELSADSQSRYVLEAQELVPLLTYQALDIKSEGGNGYDCPIRAGPNGSRRCGWKPLKDTVDGFPDMNRVREHVGLHGLLCPDCDRVFTKPTRYKEHRDDIKHLGCSERGSEKRRRPYIIDLDPEIILEFFKRPSKGQRADRDAWLDGFKILHPGWEEHSLLPTPHYRLNVRHERRDATETVNGDLIGGRDLSASGPSENYQKSFAQPPVADSGIGSLENDSQIHHQNVRGNQFIQSETNISTEMTEPGSFPLSDGGLDQQMDDMLWWNNTTEDTEAIGMDPTSANEVEMSGALGDVDAVQEGSAADSTNNIEGNAWSSAHLNDMPEDPEHPTLRITAQDTSFHGSDAAGSLNLPAFTPSVGENHNPYRRREYSDSNRLPHPILTADELQIARGSNEARRASNTTIPSSSKSQTRSSNHSTLSGQARRRMEQLRSQVDELGTQLKRLKTKLGVAEQENERFSATLQQIQKEIDDWQFYDEGISDMSGYIDFLNQRLQSIRLSLDPG